MKGLLLKDWYLMISYCRAFLAVVVVFLIVSFVGDDNVFFRVYPCLIGGMLPMTLYAYDEREKWCIYSQTLPVTKRQYVTSKYLMGLLVAVVILVVAAIAQAVSLMGGATLTINGFCSMMAVMIAVSLLAPALLMPFVFKLGTEKGRIAYYIVIGAACAGSTIFMNSLSLFVVPGGMAGIAVVCVVSAAMYLASWWLSVAFYQRREI